MSENTPAAGDLAAIPSKYDASIVEQKWYAAWEAAGLFQPDPDPAKPKYCITIPPPNITGSLHMGHALCYPIQDLVGRYQRLRGKSVLILPGQDHAGIATQSVVAKQLKAEGVNPVSLGREKFVERVWQWRKESGDTIINQFRRLGCAFDWTRTRFTLDEHYHDAVLKVFIDWFEKGWIYRGKRVVNWDPILKTSVSDIETERRTVKGKLYHVRYPFADGSGEVVIATTRPETMLADVAVAVHPSDKRYQGLVGKNLVLPLMNREIPLIADIYPDPEFGTGAVKITPAHDPNDFEVGTRHGLPMPVLLDESAKVTAEGGKYAGMDRIEARKVVVADLEEQGYLVKIEDHEIPLLVSERSGEPIEPLLSDEWFCKQGELAQVALKASQEGKVKFVPERYTAIFEDWLSNIRDWNISRRLWWGHRIPVYYTEDGSAFAAMSWDDAQAKAGDKKIVRQDEDVLDTWFSSGLWPFATLGWPGEGDDLKTYYPTDLLVTAKDIIFLWVARMVMMGVEFAGNIPFREVYIYATVLTEDGRRMSKSLGTGVDPMTIIETKGADALRYTLLSQTGYNQDIRYSDRRTDDARNFCNKIWNAVRFVLMNVEGSPAESGQLEDVDRWLLSRLYATEKAVSAAYETYDNQTAAQALYKFFWSELCDWYIEVAKPRLNDPARRQTPQWVLLTCIEAFVTMMHPIMPHITEEVYAHLPLPNKAPFLMAAKWPELPESYCQPEVEMQVGAAFDQVRILRSLRSSMGIAPGHQVDLAMFSGRVRYPEVVKQLAWIRELKPYRKEEGQVTVTTSGHGARFHMPLPDSVDRSEVTNRLITDLVKASKEMLNSESVLFGRGFIARASKVAVEKQRERYNASREMAQTMADSLIALRFKRNLSVAELAPKRLRLALVTAFVADLNLDQYHRIAGKRVREVKAYHEWLSTPENIDEILALIRTTPKPKRSVVFKKSVEGHLSLEPKGTVVTKGKSVNTRKGVVKVGKPKVKVLKTSGKRVQVKRTLGGSSDTHG